jgi:hypothetical protein
MTIPRRLLTIALFISLSTSLHAVRAQQPAALPMGKVVSGTATNGASAMYQFDAKTAGVLTVAVQGSGDLALLLTDADGQAVAGGTTDQDLAGSTGTEQLAVTITEAGRYRLEVRQQEQGPAKFEINAAWLSFPAFARPADPDKRPSQARALEVGRTHEDSLDTGGGDAWDWFSFTAKTGGVLTVILRPVGSEESLDLMLELYAGDNLTDAAMKSDQDLQGNMANESATITVTAGQKVYAKVLANGTASGKYRLSSSLIQ